MHREQTPITSISGLIERITFHNQDTGFFVVRARVRGHRELITLVGVSQTISVGEHFDATGTWIMDPSYGQQFKTQSIVSHPPSTQEGILKYLSSGLIKGIGPVYSKKLLSAFGEDVFDVIETTPEKLHGVEGIGEKRAALIRDGWEEQRHIRAIMVFLHEHNISTARAVRIYKTYGNEAISILRTNPYKLAQDIKGIGFLSADQIATSLGIDRESEARIHAGIMHVLLQCFESGMCGLPTQDLIQKAKTLLDVDADKIQDIVKDQLDQQLLIESPFLDKDASIIYTPVIYNTERAVARILMDLFTTPDGIEIDAEKALLWVKPHITIDLAASQEAALKKAISNKVCVITGGPGVGKTTLVNALLKILNQKTSHIRLVAPTGRASKRLSESTGQDASTIHKMLAYSPKTGKFQYDETHPLRGDVFIIDESSMIDVFLLNALSKAIPLQARVYFVGDVDQLPSVGPGQVLKDIIESNTLPVAWLTEIFRQGKDSNIITNAHRINGGEMPLNNERGGGDFQFVETKTPEEGRDLILQYMKNLHRDTPRIQILTPMKAGILGTRSLNATLQEALNPRRFPNVTIFGQKYLVGDPIIQLTNNYDKDVYNGDIGTLTEINSDAKQVVIQYEGRDILYDFGELDQIDLSYAMTIHKSQGSEFPIVIVPLYMSHYKLLLKNLIYTAVTRGKQKVMVIGEKRALYFGIKNINNVERYSLLKNWLIDYKPSQL